MSIKLIISLIVFSLFWFFLILYFVRKKKISVRYSLYWLFSAFLILMVGLFPGIINSLNRLFGFEVVSNLVVGMLITILMLITFILTIIVTKQKEQIRVLVQEVSLLESERKND